jgi:putative ABC transport system permease protein
MFKSYLKTSFRSLMKNPLTSFINIFGLALAIGICLVVWAFFKFEYSIDRFHEHKDQVYLVTYFGDMDGTLQQHGQTPRPLAKMLEEDFSQIEKVCRVEDQAVVIKRDEQVFHEQLRFADPTFLEMFTFPLKWGVASSLADPNSIIISEEMAIKYFGTGNPVGQEMMVKFDEGRSKTFAVSGVAAAFPNAHIIEFDFLANFENAGLANPGYDFNDWSAFVNATLIQVANPSELAQVERGMEKYKKLQNAVQNDWTISSFAFTSLADLHFSSGNIRNGISNDYSAEGRVGLPVIGLFMLLLACFNYVNIAIVSAARRLKEIGVRKSIGAGRSQVMMQFLAENVFVSLFAGVLGLILALTIILPWFVEISRDNLDLNLFDGNLWLFMILLLLFTGIASGIYPAFYISRFKVVNIFNGSVQFGKKNPLTKVLLGFQLVLACITITGGVMFVQNTSFQASRNWGYNQRGALYVQVPDGSAFEKLKAAMAQEPEVLSMAGSRHHLGKEVATSVVHLPDRQYEVNQFSVDANYLKTMELGLNKGRFFQEHHESDRQAIVVNELLVKNLELEQPVGQVLKIDDTRYEVIGVVDDFHHFSFYDPMRPTILTVADQQDFRYLSLRVRSGSEDKAYATLQAHWAALFPDQPFMGEHQEDVWSWFFRDVDTAATFMKAVAIVAVLLASMGLYGLVTLNVAGRIREFSIRKVLGAEVKNIAWNIVRQYVLLTVVALVVGAVAGYIMIGGMLNMLYAYPIPMSYGGIALSLAILVAVLLAVIFVQVRKVATSNPVKGLKVE